MSEDTIVVNSLASFMPGYWVLNEVQLHFLLNKFPSCRLLEEVDCLNKLEDIVDNTVFVLCFFCLFLFGFLLICFCGHQATERIARRISARRIRLSRQSSFLLFFLYFVMEDGTLEDEVFHIVREADQFELFLLECRLHLLKAYLSDVASIVMEDLELSIESHHDMERVNVGAEVVVVLLELRQDINEAEISLRLHDHTEALEFL